MARRELSPRQRRAIGAVLVSRNVAEAAQAAGCGHRTLTRWLQDPAFKAALVDAEEQAIDHAARRLVRLQEPAISVITAILVDAGNTPGVRLRAATAVLDYLLRLRELRSIEQRLGALEAAWEQAR